MEEIKVTTKELIKVLEALNTDFSHKIQISKEEVIVNLQFDGNWNHYFNEPVEEETLVVSRQIKAILKRDGN